MSVKMWIIALTAALAVSVKIAYALTQGSAAAPHAPQAPEPFGALVRFYAELPPGSPVGP